MHAKDPLPAILGATDIYVIDQILRERIAPPMRIFDAGCGGGRNLIYLAKAGYPVQGLDPDPARIAALETRMRKFAPSLAPDAFRAELLEAHSFPDACADVVLCNAVLHFARDHAHFEGMLAGAWRLLAPGGLFFARLASSIGIEDRLQPSANGVHRLPDGSDRYLVDAAALRQHTKSLGGEWLDPLKTTVVEGQRAMSTWVLRKP